MRDFFYNGEERDGCERTRGTMDISQQLPGINWVEPTNKIIVS
jgi:hypothetical protein